MIKAGFLISAIASTVASLGAGVVYLRAALSGEPITVTSERPTPTMHTYRITLVILGVLLVLPGTRLHAQSQDGAAPPPPTPVTPPARGLFHIYLLMGQSNMAGRGALGPQVDNPRVLTLNSDGQWVVARDPLHAKIGGVEPGVGPGVPFANAMLEAHPEVTIGLIPCAVGGSPLRRWVKGGDLYEAAITRAKAAAEIGVVMGVLWHQGETDATKRGNAESYEARLTTMFGDLRQDLGDPELPIVVGQLGEFLGGDKYPHADAVRAALERVPRTASHVGYADSAGLGHKGDRVHFDAEAARELGERYAKAMQLLQKK